MEQSNIRLTLLIIISISTAQKTYSLLGTASLVAGLYAGYKWFRTPAHINPSIKTLNTVTFRKYAGSIKKSMTIDQLIRSIYEHGPMFTPKIISQNSVACTAYPGLQISAHDSFVYLFSRGYAKAPHIDSSLIYDEYDLPSVGGGAKGAFIQYLDAIACKDVPIIGFDYPDSRRDFSMGGQSERICFKKIKKTIVEKNPTIKIIIIADCRGCRPALHDVIEDPSHIAALVLMAPFISAKELSDQIAKCHLSKVPFNKKLLHGFFRLYYPSYKVEDDTLYDQIHKLKSDLPIFIAYRTPDMLISDESQKKLKRKIIQDAENKNAEFITINDNSAPHSKLTHFKKVQHAINEFYKKWDLPHY